MIRRLGRWLALKLFASLPIDYQFAITLDWTARNPGWELKRRPTMVAPYPPNVSVLWPRRRLNPETVFNVPEIGR